MQKPTICLYDQDAYQSSFSAAVLACSKDERNSCYHVILDRTCFFPEQGGQSADTGWIGDEVRVLDTQIENGIIDHLTDKPLEIGATIQGMIDFERRFDFMQHHTGEHIFSGLVFQRYALHNVGFHLSDRTVTMDYDGFLTTEQVQAIEWEANQVIWRNLPVQVSLYGPGEPVDIEYRSKKTIDGTLRLVTIPGVDVCACCAPHVLRTGEIGQLRVISTMRYKGGVRLQILCGGRALTAARQENDLLNRAARLLSCSGDQLFEKISTLVDREKELGRKMEESLAAELMTRAEQISPEKQNPVLYGGNIQEKTAIAAADRLAELHGGICGILFEDGAHRRVVLTSHTVPLKNAAQELRRCADFKGGGDDGCIRGQIGMDAAEVEAWLNRYLSSLSID